MEAQQCMLCFGDDEAVVQGHSGEMHDYFNAATPVELQPASSSSAHQKSQRVFTNALSVQAPLQSGGIRSASSNGSSWMPTKFGAATYLDTFNATVDPSQPSATYNSMQSNQPPPATAPIQDRLEFLHGQLDTFGVNDVILGRFCLLGFSHRRQGGVILTLGTENLSIGAVHAGICTCWYVCMNVK
jgi:hypothetical protein